MKKKLLSTITKTTDSMKKKLLSTITKTTDSMKKKLFSLFAAIMAAAAASAYDFKVDGIYYDIINADTRECEVTHGDGVYSGKVNIPSNVECKGNTYTVTGIGKEAFSSCMTLTSVEIPNSVMYIDKSAFDSCRSLTSVKIPSSVTWIGDNAFSRCSSLEYIEIPNTVTSIEMYTFYGCSGLRSIEIPSSVTLIKSKAFCQCPKLLSVTSLATIPPTIESDTFASDMTGLSESNTYIYGTLRVPDASVAKYMTAAGWKRFHNFVKLSAGN